MELEIYKKEQKILKSLPKLVLELETKKIKEEFDEHMLNKHLYG